MAKGKRPDWEVFISEKGSDEKNHYTKIGAAWNVSMGGISVKLKALPLDGNIVIFPPKEDGN